MFGVATLIHSSIKAAMIRMHSVRNRRRSKKVPCLVGCKLEFVPVGKLVP